MESEIPKITKCGLRNIGNTCYMNSTLQLLIHNKLLFSFYVKTNNSKKDIFSEVFNEVFTKIGKLSILSNSFINFHR